MSFEGTSTVVSLPNPGLALSEVEDARTIWQEGRQDMMPQTMDDTSNEEVASQFEGELSFAEDPVTIVAPDTMSALGQAASARGYLWIPLTAPGPAHRGRLGLYIEETIENELEERGALPPGIVASTGLDASVSDQLYRARLIEMRGIALGIPSLEGITNLGRTLDADDSSVLRWWMAATSDRPVRLLVSAENSKLRVYPSPVFFDALLDFAPKPVSPRPPHVDMAQSAETMDLSDLPPQVALLDETNVLGTCVAENEAPSGDEQDGLAEDYLLRENGREFVALDRALGLNAHESQSAAPREETAVIEREELQDLAELLDEEASDNECEVSAQDHADATDDELDPDEFLRDLAEDSARAPEASALALAASSEAEREDLNEIVSAESTQDGAEQGVEAQATAEQNDDEQSVVAQSESVPELLPEKVPAVAAAGSELPTKKIGRTPFIRFAHSSPIGAPAPAAEPDMAQTEESSIEAPIAAQTSPIISCSLHDNSEAETFERGEQNESEVEQPSASMTPPRLHKKEFDPNDPFNQLAAQKWQSWVANLIAARGPKPLSVIERMFVTDYTRLREAVRRGVANESANEILDEWRDSFTNSYSEAYDALRVRGKRPTMVLDLPELAKRLGRLQGAKRVQLFLVDGMRFDLGLMIQDRMRKCAAAALTERLLLWSALPSVTSHQLELLGRGPDGLKENPKPDESPTLVARGRAALTPRRVRAGNLEILKLDVVEDMLRQPGLPVLDRMDEIADITADTISAHIEKLPERTMVVVFGDHGFALDPSRAGTTAEVRQGGASPEEVLVPAFAWLTGATH